MTTAYLILSQTEGIGMEPHVKNITIAPVGANVPYTPKSGTECEFIILHGCVYLRK